jgi:heme A synthase
MNQNKEEKQIIEDFRVRQSRQFLAIAVTLLLLVLLTLIYKRPNILGEFSKNTIFTAQLVVIAAFVGFSALNWRCPACNKYLGRDINRNICKKCGKRFC